MSALRHIPCQLTVLGERSQTFQLFDAHLAMPMPETPGTRAFRTSEQYHHGQVTATLTVGMPTCGIAGGGCRQ